MVGKSTSQVREIEQRLGRSKNFFFQVFGQKRVDNGFGIARTATKIVKWTLPVPPRFTDCAEGQSKSIFRPKKDKFHFSSVLRAIMGLNSVLMLGSIQAINAECKPKIALKTEKKREIFA